MCRDLQKVFGIKAIPSDTQMRTILDRVAPEDLRPLFKGVFSQLQRGKVLEKMTFLGKYYLVSIDGTGYFSSKEVFCDSCLEKKHRDGSITYSHQMLGVAYCASRAERGDSPDAGTDHQTGWRNEKRL